MALRFLIPLLAAVVLAGAPAVSHASEGPVDDDHAEEVLDGGSPPDDAAGGGDDAAHEDEDEDAADEPSIVDVVVTLPDGTVAGSARHRWAVDDGDLPTGYTLNGAGKKAAKKGRVKLRLKAIVHHADGTTETFREAVWIGKAKPKAAAKAKKRPVRR